MNKVSIHEIKLSDIKEIVDNYNDKKTECLNGYATFVIKFI